jgi:hypothetical protein
LLPIVHEAERVERLRTMLSGFCHRCRNSLNGIKLSLYLFRREARGAVPDSWGEIEAIYQQVEHLFDHLQTIYRPMTITMVRWPLGELIHRHVSKWRAAFESRGRALQLHPPEAEVTGDFDPGQLGVGLDAMVAWRAEVGGAGGLARVAWGVRDGAIEVRWREANPDDPRDPPEPAGVFARRNAGCSSSRVVDVLAMPLLARIVAAHGGRLHRERGPGFGVLLRWPQYRRGDHDGVA